ncbi:MAG: M13 family metallopeptidase [Bacteroidia bacterium]|nr:M13 family metallopeptidase [Bacteroidia bacterium]MCC7532664.1 M13 family metallopeptidase [Bacteroidia bacterium]
MKIKLIIESACSLLLVSAFMYTKMFKGVDIASIDKTVDPKDDFFMYANGNWIKNNPIPESESRWSAFNVLAEQNNILLKKILEEASQNTEASPESNTYKIGTFYRVAMDTMQIDKQGFLPIQFVMNGIDAITNSNDFIARIAELQSMGISVFFNSSVSQDVKNSSRYSLYIEQGGLSLPDRDYYLKKDERTESIRKAYMEYIKDVCMQYGNYYEGLEKEILMAEIALAKSCMTRTERRDMEKQYNPIAYNEMALRFPSINWDVYFNRLGFPRKLTNEPIIVMQPEYLKTVNLIFSEDLKKWKNYLKWRVLTTTAPYLHNKMVMAHFNFYGKTFSGAKEIKPRWKRVIAEANGQVGEIVAQEYVKVAFTPESKARVNKMVDYLSESFKDRIQKLDWMGSATKEKALEKLNSFTRKLGYPDKWHDLSELIIIEDSYIANFFNSNKFWNAFNLNKFGKPVDKTEWEMLPQTVNAYYNPVNNEIVFPAAIMQPPFFNPDADDAVNYGAIGAVIGHEFSHGFDDQGSKYDAQGNLNDWWTAEDRKLFEERTSKLVNQFNGYEALDSVFVNGELTLGENIADLAGLTVAYDAFQRSLKGTKKKKIDGYTPEQQFFLGFGQVWRGHAREAYTRQQVVTDPHSPAKFRVLGTLSNMPQFYSAFKVKKGDKMWRPDSTRVVIW